MVVDTRVKMGYFSLMKILLVILAGCSSQIVGTPDGGGGAGGGEGIPYCDPADPDACDGEPLRCRAYCYPAPCDVADSDTYVCR